MTDKANSDKETFKTRRPAAILGRAFVQNKANLAFGKIFITTYEIRTYDLAGHPVLREKQSQFKANLGAGALSWIVGGPVGMLARTRSEKKSKDQI